MPTPFTGKQLRLNYLAFIFLWRGKRFIDPRKSRTVVICCERNGRFLNALCRCDERCFVIQTELCSGCGFQRLFDFRCCTAGEFIDFRNGTLIINSSMIGMVGQIAARRPQVAFPRRLLLAISRINLSFNRIFD